MASTTNNPVVVPASEEKTYDTILVLATNSQLNPTTMQMTYTARVGLGRALNGGGYEVLRSSVKVIHIENMFTQGTPEEVATTMQIVDYLKLRYEAVSE